jgi:hypothetical protein
MFGTKLTLKLLSTLKESPQTSEMDGNTADVTSKLKFIGLIQKGEKINVRHMCVQPDTFITRFSRTFISTDNRSNAFNFIESVVNRSFEIITIALTRDPVRTIDKRLVKHILQDLAKAITGIKNFRETYIHDIMFCCRLDSMIESIESRLKDINETYVGYFDIDDNVD